jgi:hypothetical protein
MNSLNTLNAPQILALSRLVSEPVAKRAQSFAVPGTYEVAVDAHVTGEVKIGKPYLSAKTQSVPWQALAMAAMSRLNVANQNAALVDAGLSIAGGASESKVIKTRVEEHFRSIRQSTTSMSLGPVKVALNLAVRLQ